jgi:hypothetical protein
MADPASASLLPVIVGGLLTMAGGVIGGTIKPPLVWLLILVAA